MADMMSILSANYKSVGLAVPSKTKYVAVDPKLYQGSWTGKYANNKRSEEHTSELQSRP